MNGEIHTITPESEYYPPLLREIPFPPAQLYIRGNIELLQHVPLLAVVGSRKASAYGKQSISYLLPPVIAAGVPIVSGLAFGIDSLAHRTCVEAKAPTIAVLGSGIDDHSIYPRAHISLAHHILEYGGTLLSEYPAGVAGYKSNFPERNRIIAGLCQATLIVQAAEHSGSLITAKCALESNRDVWAVPGNITDPLAQGTNFLIAQGATPITKPGDILHLLGLEVASAKKSLDNLPDEQLALLHFLSDAPLHIDAITSQTGQPPEKIAVMLTELELTEHVQHVGGMKYVRK